MRKKSLCAIIFFLFSIVTLGCGDKPNTLTSLDPRTNIVREGHFTSYPNVNIGTAYNAFFSNPQWKYFETKDNEKVVEFSGGCSYLDTPVKVKQQFKIHSDNSFEAGYLAFNDVPQAQLISAALIAKVFESYNLNQNKSVASNQAQSAKSHDYPDYRNGTEKDAQGLLFGTWEDTGNARDLGLPKILTLNSRNSKIITNNNVRNFSNFPNGYDPSIYIGNDDSVFWVEINGSVYRIHIEYGKRRTMIIASQRSNGTSRGEQYYIIKK